jgi:asparagine N-glycosylation enzyme membrane subunit Stt3
MTTVILILIACATVITSIINFAKPAYKKFAWEYANTITIGLSFLLWIVASFSVSPYLWIELNTGVLTLLWLALGTWSNLFYDLWELIKWAGAKLKATADLLSSDEE